MWFDAVVCVCADAVHVGGYETLQSSPSLSSGPIYATPCSDAPPNREPQDKVLNLTGRELPGTLLKILSNGPNFALSRQVCKKVMYNVEKGIERGAFALRWKLHIDGKQQQYPGQQKTHQSQQCPAPALAPPQLYQQQQPHHCQQKHRPLQQNTHSDADGKHNPQCTEQNIHQAKPLHISPRFSDTDTRMAPPADTATEQSLRSLKSKIMKCYKNHDTNNTNHSKQDLQALNDIRADSEVIIKRSDKCKGFVLMPTETYIKKAETITSQYEHVSKNPTPRLEAATKKLISQNLAGKVSEKIVSAIKPSSSRTAELYGLPKSHKVDIPLRPIVSACGDPLDKLTWFLERIISQLLAFVPAHLKNTTF